MATDQMSREEVSMLGSARREEVRRQIENSEKLKANPLLYLVSPQVKVRYINRVGLLGAPIIKYIYCLCILFKYVCFLETIKLLSRLMCIDFVFVAILIC